MIKLLCVGLGGFLGSCLRYIISINVPKLLGNQIPFGTLLVNVVGGLLIGIIMHICNSSDIISPNQKLFLTTGMMGGLTTFSTFSYETISLFNTGSYVMGALNISLNLILSLIGVIIGTYMAKVILQFI